MASREQFENFLTNVLKIKDWKFLNKDTSSFEKINLLRQIVKSHVYNVYFQNVSMAATDPEKRHGPTLKEIVNDVSNNKGGVCIQLNYFLRLVLNYLGYDAFSIAASVTQGSILDSHCCTVVRITDEELFFVDVACGLPLEEPIPLHRLPYRNMAAGYPYEYRRTSQGVYQRMQLYGSFTKGDFVGESKEEMRYSFTLVPRTLEFFDSPMHDVFTNAKASCFLRNTFLFRHFNDENELTDREKFILIWGTTVVIGGKQTRDLRKYDSYDDLIPVMKKYFPNLNYDEVPFAMDHWKQFKVIFTNYIS